MNQLSVEGSTDSLQDELEIHVAADEDLDRFTIEIVKEITKPLSDRISKRGTRIEV